MGFDRSGLVAGRAVGDRADDDLPPALFICLADKNHGARTVFQTVLPARAVLFLPEKIIADDECLAPKIRRANFWDKQATNYLILV